MKVYFYSKEALNDMFLTDRPTTSVTNFTNTDFSRNPKPLLRFIFCLRNPTAHQMQSTNI